MKRGEEQTYYEPSYFFFLVFSNLHYLHFETYDVHELEYLDDLHAFDLLALEVSVGLVVVALYLMARYYLDLETFFVTSNSLQKFTSTYNLNNVK